MQENSLRSRYVFIWIFLFCLTQLVACSFVGRDTSSKEDGPPKVDIDISDIKDAVPKKERLSKTGNKPYKVFGRNYKVLKTAKGYDKVGVASWYGSNFHGKPTSTMETYSLYGMTAASTELPLPTYVKVTNLRNKKTAIVKVNDRGPFANERILDLSYAAAKKLGFVGEGLTKVRVTAIDPDEWQGGKSRAVHFASNDKKSPALKGKLVAKDQKKSEGRYLQVGAFGSLASAQKLSQKIKDIANVNTKVAVTKQRDARLFRVHVGPFYSESESNKIQGLLRDGGIGKAIVVAVN